MFWIQETKTTQNNVGYKFFYADYETDVLNLPTQTEFGKQENDDTVSNQKVSAGSECFVLESGSAYILGKATNRWIKI